MGNDVIELIAKIAQGGTGGAALIIVYFAFRSYQAVQDGVEQLKALNESLREQSEKQTDIHRIASSNTTALDDIGRDIIRIQADIGARHAHP